MFNMLLLFVINIFTFPIKLATSIITIPVTLFLNNLFPSLTQFRQDFLLFFQDYFLRGIGFAREVFLNVTQFPRPLFYIIVTYFASKLGLHFAFILFRFFINLYFLLRGTKTIKS